MKLNLKYNKSKKSDSIELNMDYEPLTEASTGGGGGVAGFVGTGGQEIDDIFAGGFLATDNLLIDLQQQLADTLNHRAFSDEKTPDGDFQWVQLKTNLEVDDVIKGLDVDKYKNDTNKMKNIDLSYIYDREEKKDMSSFKNETNNWKIIDIYKEL